VTINNEVDNHSSSYNEIFTPKNLFNIKTLNTSSSTKAISKIKGNDASTAKSKKNLRSLSGEGRGHTYHHNLANDIEEESLILDFCDSSTENKPSTGITTAVKSGARNSTSKNLSQKEVKQIEEEDRLNKYLENRGEIRAAEAPRSALSKAWAILSNPVTAAQYAIAGRGLPEHFDRGPLNSLEHAVNVVNPMSYVNAVADVPEAGYEFIKDPSLEGGVRLGGDLLQAVPFVSGVAGGAATMVDELSPFIKKGLKKMLK
jgi:hypothetical protein